MRVLFATYPEKTHFLAMAPLASALRTAGHEVCLASQPTLTEVITQAGLTAVAVGRHRDPARLIDLDPQWRETGRVGLTPPYDVADDPAKATWDYLYQGFATQVTRWHRMENVPMIADLVAFARHWKPDLIVWEPTTFAGAIAAKACGAAHARLLFGLDIYGVTRDHYLRLQARQPRGRRDDPLADWLGGYARKYGGEFSEDMVSGQFTIQQLPASLRMEADLDYVPLRYTPYGGAAVVPEWLWERPARPRIALTLGLVATERFGGYTVDPRMVLDSLADLDVEIVATVSPRERTWLGRLPNNARVFSYVPLQPLAATCAAAIHHAGFGTLSTMALYAVPQLVVPGDIDGPIFGRMLAGQGCALVAGDAGAIRDRVIRLLSEQSFRDAALDLRDEFLALPTPNELVPQLVELAGKHRFR